MLSGLGFTEHASAGAKVLRSSIEAHKLGCRALRVKFPLPPHDFPGDKGLDFRARGAGNSEWGSLSHRITFLGVRLLDLRARLGLRFWGSRVWLTSKSAR